MGDALKSVTGEVAAEGADVLTVPLAGETVRVLPVMDWPASAYSALTKSQDFDAWAAKCLCGDDYEDVWLRVDPTIRHLNDFFEALNEASGQDVGESAASGASSKRTKRR